MSRVKPLFLLAGGGPRNTEAEAAYLARALQECESAKPRVVYIGTASGDNAMFFGFMRSLLHKAGAGEITMAKLAKRGADIASAKKLLAEADAVFLSGGEVDEGMLWLVRHGLADFMLKLRDGGKVFIGVSAGAIMMGSKWVRWENESDDSTAALFDCLGFIPAIFDTHAEDEDWKELKCALRLQGEGSRGYGIHRGGMAVFSADGRLTAEGEPLLRYACIRGSAARESDIPAGSSVEL